MVVVPLPTLLVVSQWLTFPVFCNCSSKSMFLQTEIFLGKKLLLEGAFWRVFSYFPLQLHFITGELYASGYQLLTYVM